MVVGHWGCGWKWPPRKGLRKRGENLVINPHCAKIGSWMRRAVIASYHPQLVASLVSAIPTVARRKNSTDNRRMRSNPGPIHFLIEHTELILMPLSEGNKLGPYEILAPLARGGMDSIRLIRQGVKSRPVAFLAEPRLLFVWKLSTPKEDCRMNTLRISLACSVMGMTAVAATNSPATFNKDVLPILQNKCQGCHRPGEVAPMSFVTYGDTRPWAKAMKAAILTKKMPPWFAEQGHFTNDPTLTRDENRHLGVMGKPRSARRRRQR